MTTHFRIGQIAIDPVALGTMYFGTRVRAKDAAACLDTAFEVGARFWDTANNYAFWADGTGDEAETTIGHWLARRGPAVRDQVVLATKVGARPTGPGTGLEKVQGLSRAAIRSQLEGSLRRLGVDHVDVLYAHIDDAAVPLTETLGALSELVEEGSVVEIAASNLTVARLQEALCVDTKHTYAALQQRFTYLVPAPGTDLSPHVLLDDRIADLCTSNDVTMLGYSPLLSGAYTREDRPLPVGYTATPAASSTLRQVAADHGLDVGQTVLAWMVERPQPVIPVVGVSRPEQVLSAWTAVTTALEPDAITMMTEARHG